MESPLPPSSYDLSSEVVESPPPTPPVRCSSLSEQQQQSAGILWQLSFDAMQRQHIDLLCGRQLSHLNNGPSNEQAINFSLSSNSSSVDSQNRQKFNGQGQQDLQQLPPLPSKTKTGYHTYNRSNPEENGLPLVEQHYFEPSVILNTPAVRSSMVGVSNGHNQPNQRGANQSNSHSIGMLSDYCTNQQQQQQFVCDIDIDEVLASVASAKESTDLSSNLKVSTNTQPPLSPPPPLPPKLRIPAVIGGKSNDYINLQQTTRASKQHSTTNNNNNNNALNGSDIKAIQKRALYEFYLRQKEKKEKERKQAAEMDNCNTKKVRLAKETRSHESDKKSTNHTSATTKVNEITLSFVFSYFLLFLEYFLNFHSNRLHRSI